MISNCPFSCSTGPTPFRDIEIASMGDDPICSQYKRRGLGYVSTIIPHLCMYSYNFTCVECTDYDYKISWLKYIAIPLTVFYILVLLLKLSTTTGSANALVTISQLATSPGTRIPCSQQEQGL